MEQVNERVSSSKGHRSALRSLAALAQSKSAISKSSGLKKKTTKKGTVDAKDMTRLDLPFCEHLQSRKVFEAKLFYRRCRGQGSNIKDVGFFKLKVKLNRKKKRFLLSRFVSGGLCTNSDVYSWTLHLIKQNPIAPSPHHPTTFFYPRASIIISNML